MENNNRYMFTMTHEINFTPLPLIICGAGEVGRYVLRECRKNNVIIDAFCDNNLQAKELDGIPVLHTPHLHESYSQAAIIMTVGNYKPLIDQLESQGFHTFFPCYPFLRRRRALSKTYYNLTDYTFDRCSFLQEQSFGKPDKVVFHNLDLIITELCSLKCRDCSNLTQYYEAPKNIAIENLVFEIRNLCSSIDGIFELRLIGGEPFMHPKWDIILQELLKMKQIRFIWIFTNGTICPSPEKARLLSNERVILRISNYGPINEERVLKLEQWLQTYNIKFIVPEIEEWLACCDILSDNKRPSQENQQIFEECCIKDLTTLTDGKLFRCPYISNAYRLKAVPNNPRDYVEITDTESESIQNRKILSFLNQTTFLPACNFCPGRSNESSPVISPAIQLKKPLPYKELQP